MHSDNIQDEDMVEEAESPTKLHLNVEDITDIPHCEQDIRENVSSLYLLHMP